MGELELPAHDAGAVAFYAFEDGGFFEVAEEVGGHGTVGNEEESEEPDEDGEDAAYEEHDAPPCEGRIGDVLEGEGH